MAFNSKKLGNAFEDLFFNVCKYTPGMAVTRFPDGCRTAGRNKLIRVKTMCDWVLTYHGMTALIDTKTTESDSFPFSKVELHQVSELYEHSVSGAKTGYVIWFRKSDDVIFVCSTILIQFVSKRGSIKTIHTHDGISYLGKSRDFKPSIIFGVRDFV